MRVFGMSLIAVMFLNVVLATVVFAPRIALAMPEREAGCFDSASPPNCSAGVCSGTRNCEKMLDTKKNEICDCK
jgi:hypothetical protein